MTAETNQLSPFGTESPHRIGPALTNWLPLTNAKTRMVKPKDRAVRATRARAREANILTQRAHTRTTYTHTHPRAREARAPYPPYLTYLSIELKEKNRVSPKKTALTALTNAEKRHQTPEKDCPMADEIDQAQERQEKALEAAIAHARHQTLPAPSGACHNCAAPLSGSLRYCDGDCRDDHQRRLGALKREGRA